MEKKVPERKVSLRDEDVFYVYDKRINKCIKEGCEGTVKYGLVLRVNVYEEETINCFECNKCHMKYTPYPNYVRLSKTDMMSIYNQDEVTARDQKRAEDAAKQAAREKRKNGPKLFGNRTFENKSFEKRTFEKKPYEKRSFGAKSYEKKPYDKYSYERKPYDKYSYEKSNYESGSFERTERTSYERKPFERKSYDSRNTEYKSSYGRKSYDKSFQDRDKKPYNRYAEGEGRTFDSKPRNSKYGEVVYQGGNYKKKSNVVITSGNYKNSSFKTGGYTRNESSRQGYQNRSQNDK